AQTCALLFGGEKGHEHFRLNLRRNPRPFILDLDHYPPLSLLLSSRGTYHNCFVLLRNFQRVDEQILEDLHQNFLAASHRKGSLTELQIQTDVVTLGIGPKNEKGFLKDSSQVNSRQGRHGWLRELQQLSNALCQAIDLAIDHRQVLSVLDGQISVFLHELNNRLDGTERVLDVMGHGRCHLS